MLLQGAKVNAYPSNISLPHKCDPQEFVLLCIPSEPGTVSLSGIVLHVHYEQLVTFITCTL